MKKSKDLKNTSKKIHKENFIPFQCPNANNFLESPLLPLIHPMRSIIFKIQFPAQKNLLVIFVPSTDLQANLLLMELILISNLLHNLQTSFGVTSATPKRIKLREKFSIYL